MAFAHQLNHGFCPGRALRTGALMLGLTMPGSVLAQAVPPIVHPPMATSSQQTVKPSMLHAFAKSMTLKAGAVALAGTIFYAGTGNLFDTGVLVALGNVGATGIFMANDYLWDYFSPNTNVSANSQSFDAAASAWRNTKKYLTFKPAMAVWAWGTTYLYTGSVAATVTMGSAAFFAFPAMFYANNMAWDWYDWYSTSETEEPGASPSTGKRVADRSLVPTRLPSVIPAQAGTQSSLSPGSPLARE